MALCVSLSGFGMGSHFSSCCFRLDDFVALCSISFVGFGVCKGLFWFEMIRFFGVCFCLYLYASLSLGMVFVASLFWKECMEGTSASNRSLFGV